MSTQKNTNPLSVRVLKVKYSDFWTVKSEWGHTWVCMHPVEFDILWYPETAQVILNQNVNSKNTNPLSERVLKVENSHF